MLVQPYYNSSLRPITDVALNTCSFKPGNGIWHQEWGLFGWKVPNSDSGCSAQMLLLSHSAVGVAVSKEAGASYRTSLVPLRAEAKRIPENDDKLDAEPGSECRPAGCPRRCGVNSHGASVHLTHAPPARHQGDDLRKRAPHAPSSFRPPQHLITPRAPSYHYHMRLAVLLL